MFLETPPRAKAAGSVAAIKIRVGRRKMPKSRLKLHNLDAVVVEPHVNFEHVVFISTPPNDVTLGAVQI